MAKRLSSVEPFGDDGELRVVVEVPRGSTVKLIYEPKLKSFVVSRCLPLGLAYPFDWGFIPGTEGGDGDPVDAIALPYMKAPLIPASFFPARQSA
jgi:inorganic pyrophosphatase